MPRSAPRGAGGPARPGRREGSRRSWSGRRSGPATSSPASTGSPSGSTSEEARHREEREFVRTNPRARSLAEICARAGIQYGRVDYAVRDGRLVVWEINLNPYLVAPEPPDSPRREACAESAGRLNEALALLDSPHRGAASGWRLNPLWSARVRASQRRVLHACLRMTGLVRHEARVVDWLVDAEAASRRAMSRLRCRA